VKLRGRFRTFLSPCVACALLGEPSHGRGALELAHACGTMTGSKLAARLAMAAAGENVARMVGLRAELAHGNWLRSSPSSPRHTQKEGEKQLRQSPLLEEASITIAANGLEEQTSPVVVCRDWKIRTIEGFPPLGGGTRGAFFIFPDFVRLNSSSCTPYFFKPS
jgi:hypothetical protein